MASPAPANAASSTRGARTRRTMRSSMLVSDRAGSVIPCQTSSIIPQRRDAETPRADTDDQCRKAHGQRRKIAVWRATPAALTVAGLTSIAHRPLSLDLEAVVTRRIALPIDPENAVDIGLRQIVL